jgi:hypothetical protein
MMGYDLLSLECLKKAAQETDKTKIDAKCHGSPEFAANIVWELSKVKKLVTPGTGRLLEGINNIKDSISSFFGGNKRSLQTADYFVRVFYDGVLVNFCGDKANSENYCSFDLFKAHLTDKFILNEADYKTTCYGPAGAPPAPKVAPVIPQESQKVWITVDIILIAIFIILSVFCVMKLMTKKSAPMAE